MINFLLTDRCLQNLLFRSEICHLFSGVIGLQGPKGEKGPPGEPMSEEKIGGILDSVRGEIGEPGEKGRTGPEGLLVLFSKRGW